MDCDFNVGFDLFSFIFVCLEYVMNCEYKGRYLSEVHDKPISGCSFQEMDSYESERNGRPIIVTPLFCIKCGNISEGWNYAD